MRGEKRRLAVARQNTCVNERNPTGTVRLQGEEVKKVEDVKYLESTV